MEWEQAVRLWTNPATRTLAMRAWDAEYRLRVAAYEAAGQPTTGPEFSRFFGWQRLVCDVHGCGPGRCGC